MAPRDENAPSKAGLPSNPAGRYDRQIILPRFGGQAQARLERAAIVVVGAGGLGAPVLTYLAAAGVGNLTIADDDEVAVHNLARQVLYGPADVGRGKAQLAQAKLSELNPNVTVTPLTVRIDAANCRGIVRDFAIVIDASDNAPTRYLLNDTALEEGGTYVWGAIGQYAGRASVARRGSGPCFRCLFPQPPPVAVTGVFSPVCAVVGGWMAGEAIAVAAGLREPATGVLFQADLFYGEARTISVKSDISCPHCGGSSKDS